VAILGLPDGRVSEADVERVLGLARERMRLGFTVTHRRAPSLTGTSMDGGLLATDAGAWSGAPSAFDYRWSRCAPDGSCQRIAGARLASYDPRPADVGYRLRVDVTASNTVSSLTVSSRLSPVIR